MRPRSTPSRSRPGWLATLWRRSARGPEPPAESLIAIALCLLVVLGSLALLRTGSSIVASISDLPAERSGAPPRAMAERARPDIVCVLTLDGLRRESPAEWPAGLRQLAGEAVVFTSAAAQAAHPLVSYRSLLTGKYPSSLILEETSADLVVLSALERPAAFLRETFSGLRPTLAADLARAGYRTLAFTERTEAEEGEALAHGFQTVDATGGVLEELVARIGARLEASDEPTFLFVRTGELHRAYGTASVAGSEPSYEEALARADRGVARLCELLRRRGRYEGALIVLTASHGEPSGAPGAGHGGLHVEQLLVPLVVKLPRAWKAAGLSIAEPVELVDLAPTLRSACGAGESREQDGVSLLPLVFRGVRGKDVLIAQTSLAEDGEANAALRSILRPGQWQILHDARSRQTTLFDLREDPRARRPIAMEEERAAELLRALVWDPGPPGPAPQIARGGAPEPSSPVSSSRDGPAAAAGQRPGDERAGPVR